jgi:hypothetical protein
MVIVEKLVEWGLAGETEILGENLSQRHFVHHKSHMTRPGFEPDRRGGKPATNRLSYGAATDWNNREQKFNLQEFEFVSNLFHGSLTSFASCYATACLHMRDTEERIYAFCIAWGILACGIRSPNL